MGEDWFCSGKLAGGVGGGCSEVSMDGRAELFSDGAYVVTLKREGGCS